MITNMGVADRTIRLLVAVAIALLYFTGKLSGVLAILFGLVSVAFVITSIVGWCPAYLPFGISTAKKPTG